MGWLSAILEIVIPQDLHCTRIMSTTELCPVRSHRNPRSCSVYFRKSGCFSLCPGHFPHGCHPAFIRPERLDVAISKGRGIQFADSPSVLKGNGECIVKIPAELRDQLGIEAVTKCFELLGTVRSD